MTMLIGVISSISSIHIFKTARDSMTVFRVRQVYRFTLKNSSLLSVPFDWRIQAELVPGTLGDGDDPKKNGPF